MNVAEKEKKIIDLSMERYDIIRFIKKAKPENARKYEKRLEQINKEIEELLPKEHK